MKIEMKGILLAAGTIALSTTAFVRCGNVDGTIAPSDRSGASAVEFGGFDMSCGGQRASGGGGRQKQVPFQQQQRQTGCAPRKFQFQQQKAVDYDVDLDCASRQVVVSKKGEAQRQKALPIQSDGKVQGKLEYPQQVRKEGREGSMCWVRYEVAFDGKARCGGSRSGEAEAYAATRSIEPARRTGSRGEEKLSLTTTVSFRQASPSDLDGSSDANRDARPGSRSIDPRTASRLAEPSPSPRVSTSPSPFPFPSPSGNASPEPSPEATPSASPSAQPSPSGEPVVFCEVEDPCPITASTELSCED